MKVESTTMCASVQSSCWVGRVRQMQKDRTSIYASTLLLSLCR